MVVVPSVNQYLTHSEELTKFVQARNAFRTLRDREFMSHLIAGSVAFTTSPVWLPDEADGEASFSVYETDHPATELDQPFLLVFRTRHFVTLGVHSDAMSSARYTGFSSI